MLVLATVRYTNWYNKTKIWLSNEPVHSSFRFKAISKFCGFFAKVIVSWQFSKHTTKKSKFFWIYILYLVVGGLVATYASKKASNKIYDTNMHRKCPLCWWSRKKVKLLFHSHTYYLNTNTNIQIDTIKQKYDFQTNQCTALLGSRKSRSFVVCLQR